MKRVIPILDVCLRCPQSFKLTKAFIKAFENGSLYCDACKVGAENFHSWRSVQSGVPKGCPYETEHVVSQKVNKH
jgi:hypothetical protein